MEPDAKKVQSAPPGEDAPAPLSRAQLRRITAGHRGLKLLVVGQGIALVVLFALVVGTIAYRVALL